MAASQSASKVVLVVILLLVAAGVFFKTRGGAAGPTQRDGYFYDLTSGQLFTAPGGSQPPIDAPGGTGKGVRAFVYACGQCTPDVQKIGYLTSVTPEARAMMQKPLDQADPAVLQNGNVIARPPAQPGGEVQWFVRSSSEGSRLARIPTEACRDAKAVECFPSR